MTTYSAERTRAICTHIRNGIPPRHAAALCHVASSTYYEWLQRYPAFADSILSAEAFHVKKHLARIDKASVKTWTAAAWTLERRYPHLFGQRTITDKVDAAAEQPISIVEVVPPAGALPAFSENAVDGEATELPPHNVTALRPEPPESPG